MRSTLVEMTDIERQIAKDVCLKNELTSGDDRHLGLITDKGMVIWSVLTIALFQDHDPFDVLDAVADLANHALELRT